MKSKRKVSPKGSKRKVSPKGSKRKVSPKGSKRKVSPKGSKRKIAPKGSKRKISPKGSKRNTAASLLRALVLAFAAVILCWPLTVTAGIFSAAAGAVAGALAADRTSTIRTPQPRLASVLLLASATLAAGVWAARLLVSSSIAAGVLGPVLTLQLSEATLWLSLVAPSVFALRFLTARRPLWAVAEILAVGLAVATGFAAHRGGMVHRPLAIGDWAWSQGIDPVLVFLVAGGAAALLLAALMLSEEHKRRIPLHMSALVLVALALLAIVRVSGLPKPQGAGELGLTGEPEDGEPERGEEQRRRGQKGRSARRHRVQGRVPVERRPGTGGGGGAARRLLAAVRRLLLPPVGVLAVQRPAPGPGDARRRRLRRREDASRSSLSRSPARRRCRTGGWRSRPRWGWWSTTSVPSPSTRRPRSGRSATRIRCTSSAPSGCAPTSRPCPTTR